MQSAGPRTCLACRKLWILSPAQHNQAWQLMAVIPGLWSCWEKGQSPSPLPVTSQIQDYQGKGREMKLSQRMEEGGEEDKGEEEEEEGGRQRDRDRH